MTMQRLAGMIQFSCELHLHVPSCHVQEALQHVPWPVDVLEAYAALGKGSNLLSGDGMRRSASTTGAGNQRPLLKMGLAEGVPEEIAPDAWVSMFHLSSNVTDGQRLMASCALALSGWCAWGAGCSFPLQPAGATILSCLYLHQHLCN